MHDGLEVKSAGTGPDAAVPLTAGLISWAEVLMVMEPAHESFIRANFPALADKPVYCLNIPDRYFSMSENLIHIIKERVEALLASGPFREGR